MTDRCPACGRDRHPLLTYRGATTEHVMRLLVKRGARCFPLPDREPFR